MNRQLERKPLVEAIIELKWRLTQSAPEDTRDPAFPIYVGRLFDRVREAYPNLVRLPASDIPDQLTPQVVKFQFRKSPTDWPIIQVGPGIASLNFSQQYDWASFRMAAVKFCHDLIWAYQIEGVSKPPEFERILLRYVNAIGIDKDTDLPTFVRQKLHTRIELPTGVAEAAGVVVPAKAINVSLQFQLSVPKGTGSLRIANGLSNDKPVLLVDLSVNSSADLPKDAQRFEDWLVRAHDTIEAWFFSLIEGDLAKEFGAEDNAATA
jgi:uncharacterized protein (TIGR04255 family)